MRIQLTFEPGVKNAIFVVAQLLKERNWRLLMDAVRLLDTNVTLLDAATHTRLLIQMLFVKNMLDMVDLL